MLVIPAFWMFQFGLAITIRLHIFPFITAAATIPFLSSVIWPQSICKTSDTGDTFNRNVVGPGRILWYSTLAILAVATISIQAAYFGKSLLPTEERIVSLVGWNSIWSMFSKTPKYSYQFSAQATLADAETIDLVNSEITTSDRIRVKQFHQSYRFRYFLQTAASACPDFTSRYLVCLVYHWNRAQTADRFVQQARIVGTAKAIGDPAPSETTVLVEVGFRHAEP